MAWNFEDGSILNTNFFQWFQWYTYSAQTLVILFYFYKWVARGGAEGWRRKSFIAELLQDGLEFPNAILLDGSR